MLLRPGAALAALLLAASPACAHFQEILPSADVLPDGGTVSVDLVFTHPMERGPAMTMARPKRVGVLAGGKVTDLTPALREKSVDGKAAFTFDHALTAPGAVTFFVEPEPYWEPAEKKWITHYAKVIVDAFASGEGWTAQVGLPVEIEPLARPTGLWTGNLFRGIVRAKGKPVPFAEVEVEWANDGSVKAPNEAFITQVIRADHNGVFAYAMPCAGWWGFAALIDGPAAKSPDGKPAKTELGGLIWVKATDMAPAAPPAAAPAAPAKPAD
jgi:cobalt/nickel transport protein